MKDNQKVNTPVALSYGAVSTNKQDGEGIKKKAENDR